MEYMSKRLCKMDISETFPVFCKNPNSALCAKYIKIIFKLLPSN